MTLRTAVFDLATNDSGISALISTRFYWRQLPEAIAYPACRYMVVASDRTTAHSGPTGLDIASIQIDCIGETSASCRALVAAVKTAFDGVNNPTYGIKSMRTNELDEFEEADNLWRIVLEFLVQFVEPEP